MSKAVTTAPAPAAPGYFTAEQVELIKRQICPGATDDELRMFLADCQRSRLDPFARQIYSIERWESYKDEAGNWKRRKKRITQISIDGFRLTAERTGEYAGQLGPEWCAVDGAWRDVWISAVPPSAARVGVLRKDFEKPLWSTAMFNDYAVRNDKTDELQGQWKKMPAVMIAKCAEMLSLRRAFPRELSGFYGTEEMMQAGGDIPRASQEIDVDPNAEPDTQQPGSAAPAAQDPNPPTAAGASFGRLSLEDMAREAARRGRIPLQTFFNSRSSAEKTRLRKIEAELVQLYPSDMGD